MPASTVCPLQIGSILLSDNFESPDGSVGLSDLGSHQKNVIHEAAGGIVMAQLFGTFPKVISWKGTLIGSDAQERSFQLQALCDVRRNQNVAQYISLSYGPWLFDGFVEDYKVTARGPSLIDYEIVFRPVENKSTSLGTQAPAYPSPFDAVIAQAQTVLSAFPPIAPDFRVPPTGQPATPPQQSAQVTALNASVAPAIAALNTAITQALQSAGYTAANIPVATQTVLQGQISAIQSTLNSVINGSDPIAASAAVEISTTLGILQAAFSNPITPLITTITVVNPNLYQLAAQYYNGDPTLYWVIADYNNLIDPLPEGTFTLGIPVMPIL